MYASCSIGQLETVSHLLTGCYSMQPLSISFVHHSTGVSASWRMSMATAIFAAYLRVSSAVTGIEISPIWPVSVSELNLRQVTNKNIDRRYISNGPIAIFLCRLTPPPRIAQRFFSSRGDGAPAIAPIATITHSLHSQ